MEAILITTAGCLLATASLASRMLLTPAPPLALKEYHLELRQAAADGNRAQLKHLAEKAGSMTLALLSPLKPLAIIPFSLLAFMALRYWSGQQPIEFLLPFDIHINTLALLDPHAAGVTTRYGGGALLTFSVLSSAVLANTLAWIKHKRNKPGRT